MSQVIGSLDAGVPAAGSRRNVLLLSFVLMVVMIGYSVAMPLLPFYIEAFGVGGTEMGWLMSTYSVMQLLCAPLWGLLSDRYGRKPILCVGVLGYTLALLLIGLANSFAMLFLARSLSGLLSSAVMPSSMAYIGENSPPGERSKSMGQLGAATGIGIILGPLVGGVLSVKSLSLPFFVGAGLAGLSLLMVIFLLPESSPAVRAGERGPASASDSASAEGSAALSPFRLYLGILLGPAGILLLLLFIMSFGMTNFQGMIGLYFVDKFGSDTRQLSYIWMLMGLILIVAQGLLVGPLTKRLGEPQIVKLGLLGGAAGFALVALARNYAAGMAALGFFILAIALIGPALNSYISALAGRQQGAVMGLNSASTSLGRIIGPLWGGYIYDVDIAYPFFSGAATLLLGLGVGMLTLRGRDEVSAIRGQAANHR